MNKFRRTGPVLVLAVASSFLAISCARQGRETARVEVKSMSQAEIAQQSEAAIRAQDAAWAKAVEAKDVAATASFYADDATLLAPGAPVASGKAAIQKTWASLMAAPGFALTFTPTKIQVGPLGFRAYELGEYQLTLKNKKGKPQMSKAQYVVVWGKQKDGSWKALVDAPTTSQ